MSSAYNIKKLNAVGGDGFVTVLKYAVVEENGKYLVPLFFNNVNKTLDSLVIYIEEYNGDAKRIAKNKAVLDKIGAQPKSVFGGDIKIKLSKACADVKIIVASGTYGDFERVNEESGEVISYKKKENRYSDKEICELTDGKQYNKIHLYKSNFLPGLIISLAAVLLLSVSFLCYLNRFAATENTFLRNGCVYSFIDRDNAKTVRIIGTSGYKRKIVIPEYIGEYKVVEILSRAFSEEKYIEDITIEGNPRIADGAFEYCSSLRRIDLGKVTAIGENTFSGCTGLSEVNAPRLEQIGDKAFASCSSLNSVRLADGKTVTLGEDVFSGCYSLCFFVCMSDIKINGSKKIFADSTYMEVLELNQLPAGVTLLSELFGYSIPNLEQLTLGKLKEVSANFCDGYSNLKRVTIKELGSGDIGKDAFSGCSSLTEFNTNTPITSVGDGSFKYTKIPSFDGAAIKQVGNYSFAFNTALTEFSLNSSITELPDGLFEGCTALNKIVLPEECTKLGANVFKDCKSLKTAELPLSIVVISDYAFSGCAKLESLVIPFSVTSIGTCAFEGCSSLTEMNVPSGVEFLGGDLFYGCDSLKQLALPFVGATVTDEPGIYYFFGAQNYPRSVKMPESLKKITVKSGNVYPSIFYGASFVEEIGFRETVEKISARAFFGCSSLKKADFMSDVVFIGNHAFAMCSSLEDLIIPDSVSDIEPSILTGCKSLKLLKTPFLGSSAVQCATLYYFFADENAEETIPASLKQVTVNGGEIVAEAFTDCLSIETVKLPNDITEIGNRAFYNCVKLKSVNLPDKLQSIGSEAFVSCYSLTSVTLPIGLKEIGNDAFASCYRLYKVYNNSALDITEGIVGSNGNIGENALFVAKPNEKIPEGNFDGFNFMRSRKGELYLIGYIGNNNSPVLPTQGIINGNFESVGYAVADYAFAYSDDLKNVNKLSVGGGVRKIGRYAFYGAESLSELSFVGSTIDELGEYAFNSCVGLKNVSLSANAHITRIGASAFANCSDLESITFYGNSYTEVIGESAFSGCAFNGIVALPENLTEIGAAAFVDCGGITSVTLPSTLKQIGKSAFYNCSSLTDISLPKKITAIPEGTFSYCASLKSVALPSGLKQIGKNAFSDCTSLTEIKLPNNLSAIGEKAFSDCSALKTVDYSGKLNTLGAKAFADCTSLESIKISFLGNPSLQNGVFFGCESLKTAELKGVKSISDEAFAECSSLEEIILPVGVTDIGKAAFRNCVSLELIQLPSALSKISDDAFLNCYNLYEIYNLSKIKITLGDSKYGGIAANAYVIHSSALEPRMEKLKTQKVTFIKPDKTWLLIRYNDPEYILTLDTFVINGTKVENYEIKDNLFENSNVYEVTFGAAVAKIGKSLFENSHSLETVTFKKNSRITEIPDESFYNCVMLKKVVFPDSLESIGSLAFGMCDLSETEELPSSLKKILGEAFLYTSLRCVYLPSSLESIGNNAFANCSSLYEVYNLSSLNIAAGSTSYGCVAQNAYIVNTDRNAPRMLDEMFDNFRFLKFGGKWYLKNMEYIYSDTIVLPSDFEINGEKIVDYTIMKNAFSGYDYIKIVIPDCVTAIENGAFENNRILMAFCRGDQKAFDTLLKEINVGAKYYYADCVHEQGQWTYDSYGDVDFSVKEFKYKEKTQATCTEDGKIIYECPYCKKTKTEVVAKATGHSYGKNGTCTKCGAKQPKSKKNAAKSDSYCLPCESRKSVYPFDKSGKKVSE